MIQAQVWFTYKYRDGFDNEIHEDIAKHEGFIDIDWDSRVVELYDEEHGEVWLVPLERVQTITRKMYPNEKYRLSQKKDEKKATKD